jgi:hypothetical protein
MTSADAASWLILIFLWVALVFFIGLAIGTIIKGRNRRR